MRVAAFLSGVVAMTFVMTAQTSGARFTATTAYVSGAGEAVRINLTNWSTEADRDQMVAAWSMTAPAAGAGGRGGRGAGGGGRGGRGARGGDGAAALPADPDAVDGAADDDSPAFRFGRGGARGRGNDASATAGTPEASLAAALKKKPTVGILWTSETVGYSIKYAYRLSQPDGGERIVLATDRRVGAWSNLWKLPESANANDYAFSTIELRMNSKGEGEGKLSMTGKLAVDGTAKTIALDGYNALPVILKGVKRQ